MDKLPSTIIQRICEYDNTYKIKFGSFETIYCSLLHL